jgi:hypothetical protein
MDIEREKRPAIRLVGFDDIYYHLTVRKYYHFEPLTIVAPTKKKDAKHSYRNNSFIPSSEVPIETVTVPPRTVARTHCFFVSSKECSDGIANYLEKALDRYRTSSIWECADKVVMEEYLDYIKRIYNVDLKLNCDIVTTQFCMEVDSCDYMCCD